MNTLHVDLGPHWRGGQEQALLLVGGLRERGQNAELVARRSGPLAKRAGKVGIAVHSVGSFASRLDAAFLLRRLLRRQHFHLLHAHDAHGLTAAWLAGAHRIVPVVASRRLAYRLTASRWARARYRTATRVVAISRFVADSVVASGIPPERVEIVFDGVSIPALPTGPERGQARQRWGVAEAEILLGCAGYLLPEKGQENLIRAMPEVLREFPSCRLLLAGDGPWRARLEKLVRKLEIGSSVHFAGFVATVSDVYSALDVFVFPSLAEPLGSSLLTAMAYALPVVAVGKGAVPEVVRDGQNGILAADSNPSAIAGAIIRLLKDTRLAEHIRPAARETIQDRFSVDHMIERTLKLYRGWLPGETP